MITLKANLLRNTVRILNSRRFWKTTRENTIVQHAVDYIILKEKKLSVKDETHENIYAEVDEDELYDIEKMSLDEKNDINVRLKANSKIYMILKTECYELYAQRQSK